MPTTVQRAAIHVCRDAFYYRDDVRGVFLSAGVPATLYDRYSDPANSKAKIARSVFADLQAAGERGYAIQRKIVEELCRMSGPDRHAPDQQAGKSALAELKREAITEHVLIDPGKAAADSRRAASQRKAAAVKERHARLGELRERFLALNRLVPRSDAERQNRGYELERLLADLFRLHDLEYRPSYKISGEQIDGSFHFRGFTYLVEAKWRVTAPTSGDILSFKAKVDGKIDSTRGIYVSMAGYDEGVLDPSFAPPAAAATT